jgi:hypothetical protein
LPCANGSVVAWALEFIVLTAARMGEILGDTRDQVDLVQTVSPVAPHEGRYRAPRALVGGFIGRLGASRRDRERMDGFGREVEA